MGLFSRRNDNAGYDQTDSYPRNTSGHQDICGNSHNDDMTAQNYTAHQDPLGSNQHNGMGDPNFSGSTVHHNPLSTNHDAVDQNYAGNTGHQGALSTIYDTRLLGQNYANNTGHQGAFNSKYDTGALGQNYHAPSHQNTFGSNHSGGMTHHGGLANNTGHHDHHYGGDAAVVGAGYEADKHHPDHHNANTGQNAGHGIFGKKHHDNTSGMNNTGHNDHHYGRDAAVVGAGYEADKHHRDHQNTNTRHSTEHGIFGNHRTNGTIHHGSTSGSNHGLNNSNQQHHHHGRDACVAGGAGLAGYEAEKHHRNKQGRRGGGGGGLSSLFGRRNRTTSTSTRNHRRSKSHSRSRSTAISPASGHNNHRPTLGQWLKVTWLDMLTTSVLGAVALGVNYARPAPSRSFPVYYADGQVVYPQFAYPLRHAIVPLWLAVVLASLVPTFVVLLMQVRIRSFWDVNNAVVGLLYSLITAAVFQVFLKWLIGGLAPHFLTVCQPVVPVTTGQEFGTGLNFIMYDRKICAGDASQISAALESFPSGHATAAFAGFGFLFFYLNGKLKVWSNHHPAMWKLVATYAPVLGATLIAGSLTVDEYSNWYDALAGAVIGGVMAVSAYRMVYASVWDFRFNHIPLTRHTPFSYGAGQAGAGGFESAVFTRAADWGFEEAFGGAPFDAAHHLRGVEQGFNTRVHGGSGHGNHGGEKSGELLGGHQNEHDDGLGQQGRSADGLAQHGAGTGLDSTGKYHGYSKSVERKPVPGQQGVGMGHQGVRGRDDIV